MAFAMAFVASAPFALASCSSDEEPPVVPPSSAFPSGPTARTPPPPTGATGSPPTGPTAVLPTIAPGSAIGNLSEGQAAVTITGEVQASKTLVNLVSAIYSPPPGGMAIVWTAGGTDATTLGIGGLSFTGSRPTAPTLSLTLTVQTKTGISSFVSTAGECTITIGEVSAEQIAAAFTCSDLVGADGEVVDASGSFAARG